MALSVDRDWSPEEHKWTMLLDTAEPIGVDAPDGDGLAGAVVLGRYGSTRASAGMMLVAARYGRQGLGRTLLLHLLDMAGDATVTLFATEEGRPLYEKLGFVPVRRSAQFVGDFPGERPGSAEITIREATEGDLPTLLKLDEEAFGEDRSAFVRRLPSFASRILISGAVGAVSGYGAAWDNGGMSVIGPVIAPDEAAARALITALASRAPGPVRLDLDPDRPGLPAWARAHGLTERSATTVMTRGPIDCLGDPDRLYTPISVALT